MITEFQLYFFQVHILFIVSHVRLTFIFIYFRSIRLIRYTMLMNQVLCHVLVLTKSKAKITFRCHIHLQNISIIFRFYKLLCYCFKRNKIWIWSTHQLLSTFLLWLANRTLLLLLYCTNKKKQPTKYEDIFLSYSLPHSWNTDSFSMFFASSWH